MAVGVDVWVDGRRGQEGDFRRLQRVPVAVCVWVWVRVGAAQQRQRE